MSRIIVCTGTSVKHGHVFRPDGPVDAVGTNRFYCIFCLIQVQRFTDQRGTRYVIHGAPMDDSNTVVRLSNSVAPTEQDDPHRITRERVQEDF